MYKLYFEVQALNKSAINLSPVVLHDSIRKLMIDHERLEISPEASLLFYSDLEAILNQSLVKHCPPANKGLVNRLFNVNTSPEETLLKTLLVEIIKKKSNSEEEKNQNWKLPLFVRATAFVTEAQVDSFNLYKNQQFRELLIGTKKSAEEEKTIFKFKNIAHDLMGNIPLESKILQGNANSIAVYKAYKQLLKFKKHFEQQLPEEFKNELNSAIIRLRDLLTLCSPIELNQLFPAASREITAKRLADVASRIRGALSKLPEGRKMLAPCGFSVVQQGGHAAIVELSKNKDGTYKVALFETGGFAERYLAGATQRPSETKTFIIETLSRELIFNSEFLDDLLKGSFFLTKNADEGAKLMLLPFKHFRDSGLLKRGQETFPLQFNKICTRAVVHAWIQVALNPLLYHCFEHFVIQHNLKKVDSLKHTQTPTTRQIICTLEASSEGKSYKGPEVVELLHDVGKKGLQASEIDLRQFIANADKDIKTSLQPTSEKAPAGLLFGLFDNPSPIIKGPSAEVIEQAAARERQLIAVKKMMGWK